MTLLLSGMERRYMEVEGQRPYKRGPRLEPSHSYMCHDATKAQLYTHGYRYRWQRYAWLWKRSTASKHPISLSDGPRMQVWQAASQAMPVRSVGCDDVHLMHSPYLDMLSSGVWAA